MQKQGVAIFRARSRKPQVLPAAMRTNTERDIRAKTKTEGESNQDRAQKQSGDETYEKQEKGHHIKDKESNQERAQTQGVGL
jgi:hypothetical protein